MSLLRLALGTAGVSLAAFVLSFDTTGMDKSVSPTSDFFRFANGGWISKTEIPPDKARVGTFDNLVERNNQVLRQAIEDAANDPRLDARTTKGKVGLFYKVAMDESKAGALGDQPIQPMLTEIDGVQNGDDLAVEIARLQQEGVSAGFRMSVEQDEHDSSKMLVGLGQGGLGLQGRVNYLSDSSRSMGIRGTYVEVTQKSFELVGENPDQAKSDANDVLAFETEFAKASSTPVQLRDTDANYHKTDLKGTEESAPGFAWDRYFDALGARNPGPIDMGQPGFFAAFGKEVQSAPIATWRAYLKHMVIAQASPFLSNDFRENEFRMSAVLRGVSQEPPRWQQVIGEMNTAMGQALGQLYVEKVFPPSAKARALTLVRNLKSVLRDRIQELDWMTPATKQQATKKLDEMAIKVGYPDHWRDYSKLLVKDDSYFANAMRARQFAFNRMFSRLGKGPDKSDWGMNPQTVNASYSPVHNDITFPAGILQPPFFDPNATDASNYGGIGAVIGHEMTHGFDDNGRKYDGQGNLRDWWTAEDAKGFNKRAEALANQYDQYVVDEETNVDGHLTLGENIADLGGLKIAYLAFHKATAGMKQPDVDGFTPDQQFFLSFAQLWREKVRPESARQAALTDPHSPPRYRVIGVLQNTPEFWEAFGAKPPENTITIW